MSSSISSLSWSDSPDEHDEVSISSLSFLSASPDEHDEVSSFVGLLHT